MTALLMNKNGKIKASTGEKKPVTVGSVLVYIGLIFWAFVSIFPVYWMLTFSLKNNAEIYGENVIGLPRYWLFSNYESAMRVGNIGRYFLNSTFVAVTTIMIVLIASFMATYAMTRLVWKGRKAMNKFFMLGLTIPIHASVVPIYIILARLQWLDTYGAIIIPYSAFSLSMGILICNGFMSDIPYDLDEAAFLDGCGVWGIFFRVITPLMLPAVATVGIYTFLQCWNELMFANVFIKSPEIRTLPVGIQSLCGQYTTEWGPIGAALSIATIPTLLVYVFLSKRIQESFIAGAVKG